MGCRGEHEMLHIGFVSRGGFVKQEFIPELHAGRLVQQACGLPAGCGPEILAGLPAMTTETVFLTVTRYQLRNTYVNGTLLVSTYLCLRKLTLIKGFPKCLSIVSN